MLEGIQPIWLSWIFTIILLIMIIMFSIFMGITLALTIKVRLLEIKYLKKERGNKE